MRPFAANGKGLRHSRVTFGNEHPPARVATVGKIVHVLPYPASAASRRELLRDRTARVGITTRSAGTEVETHLSQQSKLARIVGKVRGGFCTRFLIPVICARTHVPIR